MAHLFTLTQSKYRKRIGAIVTNSLNGLLLPVLNLLVAALVIRLASVELWGNFVNLMIIIHLGVHIVSWGNKEYLLRAFSRSPAQIAATWRGALLSRALILLGLITVLPLWVRPGELWGLAVVWAVGLAWVQSLDVFVQYRKDFVFALVVELLALAGLAAGVLELGRDLTLETLILLFALAQWLKAGLLTARNWEHIWGLRGAGFRPDLRFFSAALPFFLLGFSGMLQSRVDLYTVSYFYSHEEVGRYQVFINLIIYLQAVANFILIPFVKNLYRLDYVTLNKISQRLFLLGLVITPFAVTAIYFVLQWVYEFSFPPVYFIFGALYALPSFYYLPVIYALFKAERQNMVAVFNFSGSAFVFLLNLILLPRIGLLGAVISVAITHWGLLGLYAWQMRRLT